MNAEQESFTYLPPMAADGSARQKTYALTVPNGSSSAATLVIPDGLISGGCFVTFVSTVNCYIRFGTDTVTAAVVTDFFLPAGVVQSWWCIPNNATYFRVYGIGGAGSIVRYISNL